MTKTGILFIALLFTVQAVYGQLGSVYAVASGDSVTIWNVGVQTNCASRFVFDVVLMQDSVRMVEQDTSTRFATCTCQFNLSTTVHHLNPGAYIARVYRSHVVPSYVLYYVGSAAFVIQSSGGGTMSFNGFQSICDPNAVGPGEQLVTEYAVGQNFPNPFNPNTNISYQLPSPGLVTLKVYDVLGREAATLVNETKPRGRYDVVWNAAGAASGVYFYRLEVNGRMEFKRMILMK